MLEDKLTDNTVIDAGHYSYLPGPTELDLYLWEEGVKLYAHARTSYDNVGLMLLVDDMKGVRSNELRRTFKIKELPKSYLSILDQYEVALEEVQVVSQDRLKEKGKQLLRQQGESRESFGRCELVVGTTVRHKERQGFSNSINFYDETKTAGGMNLRMGTEISQKVFGTVMECHYLVFRDKDNHSYLYFETSE
jgi:hypothetical protein